MGHSGRRSARRKAPDQSELNFTIAYRPGWLAPTVLRGLGLTVRAALYNPEDSGRLARQIHVLLNWESDILAPASGTTRE